MVYALRLRHQCGQRRRRFVCAASALIETADISDLRYPIWPRARRKATALAGAKHTSLQFRLQADLRTVTAAGIPACIAAVPRADHHSNAKWGFSLGRIQTPTLPRRRRSQPTRIHLARSSWSTRPASISSPTAINSLPRRSFIVAALGGLAGMIDYRLQVGARFGQRTAKLHRSNRQRGRHPHWSRLVDRRSQALRGHRY